MLRTYRIDHLEEDSMDLQACTETLRSKVGDSSGLNATLKFDCGADGVAYIDGKSVPNTVHNDNIDETTCASTAACPNILVPLA